MFKFFGSTKTLILASILTIFTLSFVFWAGLVIGQKVQPRSVFALNKCEKNCWSQNEITGLIGSIGVELGGQKVMAVKENDTCFSIKIPFTQLKTHYTIIPKKDIQDIGQIKDEEMPIVNDCLKIVREHISEENLQEYQLTSNGPDYQHVRYLHFHLKSVKE